MSPIRKARRHPFSVSANLHPARGGAGTAVTVREISILGCQLENARVPKLGKYCELYFEWQGTMVGLKARVVWADARGRMGLEYQDIDEHSRRCLQELCASLQPQSPMGGGAGRRDAARAAPGATYSHGAEHPLFRSVAAKAVPANTDTERTRRTFPRYTSELHGHVMNSATGKSVEVALVDLSISGARLEGAGLPDIGQSCQLQTEWEGRHLALPATVAWKNTKQVGLKFASLDEHTKKQLRQVCANSRISPPGPRD